MLVTAAALYWHFSLGPRQMIAAIQHGDIQKISRLSNLSIRPNSDAFLVGGFMHCAAASGQIQSMSQLYYLGASVDRLDGYGVTPLHVAVRLQQIEAIRWLISHGANPSIKDREGRTAADCIPNDLSTQQKEIFMMELKKTSNQAVQLTVSRAVCLRSTGFAWRSVTAAAFAPAAPSLSRFSIHLNSPGDRS